MAPMVTLCFGCDYAVEHCQNILNSDAFPTYQAVEITLKRANVDKEEFKWLYALNRVLLLKGNGVKWNIGFDCGFNRCNYKIILPHLKIEGIQNITTNGMDNLDRFLYKSRNPMNFNGIPRSITFIPEFFICSEANVVFNDNVKCSIQVQKYHVFSNDLDNLYLVVFRKDSISGKMMFIEPGKKMINFHFSIIFTISPFHINM